MLTRTEFRELRKHHDFFQICETPELACRITIQPIDRYDGLLDAAIIFCDILVIPKAMGMTIQMVEAKGPTFDEPLVTPDDIKKLKKEMDIKKDLGYVMDAIALTRRELKGRVPLFGFIGGPWTLLGYMIEGGGSKTFTKAKSWLYKYPEESKNLLQRITDIAIDFLAEQIIAGAQAYHCQMRKLMIDGASFRIMGRRIITNRLCNILIAVSPTDPYEATSNPSVSRILSIESVCPNFHLCKGGLVCARRSCSK